MALQTIKDIVAIQFQQEASQPFSWENWFEFNGELIINRIRVYQVFNNISSGFLRTMENWVINTLTSIGYYLPLNTNGEWIRDTLCLCINEAYLSFQKEVEALGFYFDNIENNLKNGMINTSVDTITSSNSKNETLNETNSDTHLNGNSVNNNDGSNNLNDSTITVNSNIPVSNLDLTKINQNRNVTNKTTDSFSNSKNSTFNNMSEQYQAFRDILDKLNFDFITTLRKLIFKNVVYFGRGN